MADCENLSQQERDGDLAQRLTGAVFYWMSEERLESPEQWLNLYGNDLYRFALIRVREKHIAEDLVQETLLSALKARGGFDGRSSARTWLISILKRKIIDHYRKSWRTVSVNDQEKLEREASSFFKSEGRWVGVWRDDLGPKAWGGNPGAELESREFLAVLRVCLAGLPQTLANVFTLRELDELSAEDICKELNITASNLWVSLHRARLRLRNCLERNWFDKPAERE